MSTVTVEELKAKYPYMYEPHMHTKAASACARSSGREMARAHKEAGYAGIIVTDHNWGGNTCVDRSLEWTEWVDKFFEGYREAKDEGDKIGLQVFPGWEAGYGGPEFLIYGLTPQWLMEHPEIKNASVKEQYDMVHEAGGLVIQAHPFREDWYLHSIELFPHEVDGCEIVNATHSNHLSQSHNNPVFDDEAILYAKVHGFMTTCGSDVHSVNLFGGGMAFPTKLESIEDFIDRIKNGGDYVLSNGDHWYSKTGELLV